MKLITLLFISIILSACDYGKQPGPQTPEKHIISIEQTIKANIEFWQYHQNILSQLAETTSSFDSARIQFLTNPTKETLLKLQQAWKPLAQIDNHLFLFSSIAESLPPKLNQWQNKNYRLFAHPIQPGYLDSVGEYRFAGIVHDISLPITPESISQQHGFADQESATLGIYALEFLIFGEQNKRNHLDYIVGKTLTKEEIERGYKNIQETPAFRRRQLLSIQSEILVADTNALAASWKSTKKEELNRLWHDIDNSIQFKLVTAALQKGLTQLLIDISKHKKHFDQLNTAEEQANNTGALLTLSASISNKVGANIQSLKPSLNYLNAMQTQQIKEHLNIALNALQTEDETNTQIRWGILYESIKSSADILAVQ